MKMLQRKICFILPLCLSLCTFAKAVAHETVTKAIAVVHPTKGNTVNGIVTFTVVNDGVRIVADLDGLKPGDHGFHVHRFGDCSAPDASSTDDHFNPTRTKHGCPNSPEHHVGDMGNITADQQGHAHYDQVNKDIKLEGRNSVIGRAVVVHADKDDCVSQPTGNAGAKIGCGVIGIAHNGIYEKIPTLSH